MNKYAIKGTKKLLSLTRTKIRLAEESETEYTKPRPLPLVKLLSGRKIERIKDTKEYREILANEVDFLIPGSVASTVIQAMDIIEGVKYKFEPDDLCVQIDCTGFSELEKYAKENSLPINILLMTKENESFGAKDTHTRIGQNLFVGYEPPKNAILLGRVPTTLSFFLDFAFNSEYLSERVEGELKLKNVNVIPGHKTLILNAIYFALLEFGAEAVTVEEF